MAMLARHAGEKAADEASRHGRGFRLQSFRRDFMELAQRQSAMRQAGINAGIAERQYTVVHM
jgi:hypothetical protein